MDLRFSRIEYLPKLYEAEPQRFTYRQRIGFGFQVSGEGETVEKGISQTAAAPPPSSSVLAK